MAKKKAKAVESQPAEPNKLNRKQLLDVVDFVANASGSSSRQVLEEYVQVLFRNGMAWTTRGDVAACCLVQGMSGVDCRVPIANLARLLRRMSDQWVSAQQTQGKDGNHKLIFRGESLELDLSAQTGESALDAIIEGDLLIGTSGQWKPLPQTVRDGLCLCRYTASDDPAAGVFRGVYLHGKRCLATDCYRIATYDLDAAVEGEAIIPRPVLDILAANKELDEWLLTEKTVAFRDSSSKAVVVATLLTAQFEDVGSYVDAARKWPFVVTLPESLKPALMRQRDQLREAVIENPFVRLAFKDTDLNLESSDDTTYRLLERIPLDTKIETPFSFSINPDFLLAILDRCKCMRYDPGVKKVEGGRTAAVAFFEPPFSYLASMDWS